MPVLVVVDMLADFLDRWPAERRQRVVDATRDLVTAFRTHGQRVIWVRQEFEPDLSDAFLEMRTHNIATTIKGTRGCEIVPELSVRSDEPIVVKKRYSAFFGTNLDALLVGVDRVIIAGVNTHACIRMTVIDAYQRDHSVIVATDCVDSLDDEHHRVTLRYLGEHVCELMSNAAIKTTLEKTSTQL